MTAADHRRWRAGRRRAEQGLPPSPLYLTSELYRKGYRHGCGRKRAATQNVIVSAGEW